MTLSSDDLQAIGTTMEPIITAIVTEAIDGLALQVAAGFDEVHTRIDVLQQDVSVLKQDVSVLKQDVGVLKQDVSVLKQDMIIIKADSSDLKIVTGRIEHRQYAEAERLDGSISSIGHIRKVLKAV